MKIWVDAQLSPSIATWINRNFAEIEASSVHSLGLRDATDWMIFQRAREQNVTVMTKDSDFVNLQEQYGAPPKIILICCGNSSNARMREILTKTLIKGINLLKGEENLIEIRDVENG